VDVEVNSIGRYAHCGNRGEISIPVNRGEIYMPENSEDINKPREKLIYYRIRGEINMTMSSLTLTH